MAIKSYDTGKIIRHSILVLLSALVLGQGIHTHYTVASLPQITRCGEITYKGTKDQINKYSTENKFILVVKFQDTNKHEDVQVSASTWSRFTTGDVVCFNESVKLEDIYGKWYVIVAFICWCLSVLAALAFIMVIGYLLIVFVRYLATGNWNPSFQD